MPAAPSSSKAASTGNRCPCPPDDRGDNFRGLSRSSFTSVESAQKLVNATLASDPVQVADVVAGRRPYGVINYEAGSYTGYEAYLDRYNSTPYIRGTYGVRVVIRPDPGSERGYRIVSAFPTR
jgi:Bacterial CdiA-CT RNAse A domain